MRNNFFTLKQQINEIVKSVEFERNTAITRAFVETKIQQLMVQQENDHQLYDYTVVCDERNNPTSVIENNDIVANITWKDIFGNKHYYEVSFQGLIKEYDKYIL